MLFYNATTGEMVFEGEVIKGNINHCIANLFVKLSRGQYDIRTIRKIKEEAKELLKESYNVRQG